MKTINTYISRVVVLLCAMMLSVGIASAQSMLKGLAGKAAQKVTQKVTQKATQKVEQKIEQKLEGTKVGKAVKTAKAISEAGKAANDNTSDVMDDYPELLGPDMDERAYWDFEIDKSTIAVPTFTTYADALKAWPATPTAAQLQDEAAMRKYYIDFEAFNMGLEKLMMERTVKQTEVGMGLQTAQGSKLSAEARAYSDKMMAAIMALPAAEREKIAQFEDKDADAMLAYMKTNHPDIYKIMMSAPTELKNMEQPDESRMDAYSEIMEKLEPFIGKMTESLSGITSLSLSSLMTGDITDALPGPQGAMYKVRKEIAEDWIKSAECAKVKAMEEDLNKRVREYDEANMKADKFYSYPPFWSGERAKQNEVIDAYNAKVAERWIAAVGKLVDENMPNFELLAEQDARLQALGWNDDAEKTMYYTTSAMVGNAAMSLFTTLFTLPTYIFGVPFVAHTNTAEFQ